MERKKLSGQPNMINKNLGDEINRSRRDPQKKEIWKPPLKTRP